MERTLYRHNRAYNLFLHLAFATVLVGGLYSLSSPMPISFVDAKVVTPQFLLNQKAEVSQAPAQEQPAPAVVQPQIEKVSVLPGKDGSSKILTAPAKVGSVSIPLGPNNSAMNLGRSLSAIEFGDQHWSSLEALWTKESGWNPGARNRSSGACGIPQALPCSKIPDMSPQGQIEWGLHYIKQRYGTPSAAWAFWRQHHWY